MNSRMLMVVAMSLSLPLMAQAGVIPGVTKAEAKQAALAAVDGGTVLSEKYVSEGRRNVWAVNIRKGGFVKQVWVDPVSRMVIKIRNASTPHRKVQGRRRMMVAEPHAAGLRVLSRTIGITKSAAEMLAVRALHGGRVLNAKKVRRGTITVWSVDMKTSKGYEDVWINPENGKVLKISCRAGSTKIHKN